MRVDFKKKLCHILRHQRIDPAEPKGLTDAVYRRIEVLKLFLEQGVNEREERCIRAILASYRTGQLQVEPGKVSYWKGGVMKRGLGDPIPAKQLTQWVEALGEEQPGEMFWDEDVSFTCCTVIPLPITPMSEYLY